MAVLEVSERHQELVDEVIEAVAEYKPDLDRDLVARAFSFAASAHAGQQRRSGEEFINHPFGVAKILAELHLDEQTIAAALLHDVVEDTDADLKAVRDEFGDEIAQLVDGVTKHALGGIAMGFCKHLGLNRGCHSVFRKDSL